MKKKRIPRRIPKHNWEFVGTGGCHDFWSDFRCKQCNKHCRSVESVPRLLLEERCPKGQEIPT